MTHLPPAAALEVLRGRPDLIARPATWSGTAMGVAWTEFPEPDGGFNDLNYAPSGGGHAFNCRAATWLGDPACLGDDAWEVLPAVVLHAEMRVLDAARGRDGSHAAAQVALAPAPPPAPPAPKAPPPAPQGVPGPRVRLKKGAHALAAEIAGRTNGKE